MKRETSNSFDSFCFAFCVVELMMSEERLLNGDVVVVVIVVDMLMSI
jgi:hypothetical protein